MRSLFRKKTIESVLNSADKKSLPKTLGSIDLVLLGIGCIIGTGIFVLTGPTAAHYAGPGVSISYLLAGLVCIFAGLAYAELAALIPVAGGAYTYTYTIIGEFLAWIVAWGLILEYTLGASAVASGWSGYFVGILKSAGITLPEHLTKGYFDGGLINIPAIFITIVISLILIRGTKESALVNRILVGINLVVITLFVIISVPHISMENYAEFVPFGWNGIFIGAGAIFFAFIGFDSVATSAEEAKNPNRDLPIGIIGSLLICIIIYIVVSLSLTGITHYSELGNSEPMAYALRQNGSNIGSSLVASGVIVGMSAVLLVMMFSQSRIFFVMSRDGLIPQSFSKLHKKFQTPYVSCSLVSVAVMIISGLVPVETLSHMTSLGTLFAFTIASVCVMVLRITKPDLERPFKCPLVFLVAPTAILGCGYLIYKLLTKTGIYFSIWIALSILVYVFYTYKKSPLKFVAEKHNHS
jgi:APA family basic amino acid/polyamine antiporter